MDQKARLFTYADRVPILAISIHHNYFCAILAILLPKKVIFVTNYMIFPVWNKAFSEIYPELKEKCKVLQDFCGKKIRNLVWDESKAFMDVVSGFATCRKDLKWQDRGIPLLREMMLKEKIFFSQKS